MNINELKDHLVEAGFQPYINPTHFRTSKTDWYACRKVETERECECNEGKRMQLTVWPYKSTIHDKTYESVEVDITGEYKGVWYKLQAYSLSPDELVEKLDSIENSLVAAWNSLDEG